MVPETGIEPVRPLCRKAADFLHTADFTADLSRLCAGLCLDHCVTALDPRRLVSTPSHYWAWLGVASIVLIRGFSEFDAIHSDAFAFRCSNT